MIINSSVFESGEFHKNRTYIIVTDKSIISVTQGFSVYRIEFQVVFFFMRRLSLPQCIVA